MKQEQKRLLQMLVALVVIAAISLVLIDIIVAFESGFLYALILIFIESTTLAFMTWKYLTDRLR